MYSQFSAVWARRVEESPAHKQTGAKLLLWRCWGWLWLQSMENSYNRGNLQKLKKRKLFELLILSFVSPLAHHSRSLLTKHHRNFHQNLIWIITYNHWNILSFSLINSLIARAGRSVKAFHTYTHSYNVLLGERRRCPFHFISNIFQT